MWFFLQSQCLFCSPVLCKTYFCCFYCRLFPRFFLKCIRNQLGVRHAFNKYDSDGSGNIDRSEFAALLRHIGVNFTATQFENAVTQLDPNDDGIDFDEFIDW